MHKFGWHRKCLIRAFWDIGTKLLTNMQKNVIVHIKLDVRIKEILECNIEWWYQLKCNPVLRHGFAVFRFYHQMPSKMLHKTLQCFQLTGNIWVTIFFSGVIFHTGLAQPWSQLKQSISSCGLKQQISWGHLALSSCLHRCSFSFHSIDWKRKEG